MGEVTINVNGRPYRMACEDGQEAHLSEVGAMLAGRVADIASQVGQVGDATLLVMAGLLATDEANQAGDGAPDPAVAQERDALKAEVEQLRSERGELAENVKAMEAAAADMARLEADLEALVAERDALKAEAETLRNSAGAATSADDALRTERDGLAAELERLREAHDALAKDRDARATAEENAAQAIEALTGRVARLTKALEPAG